MHRDLRPSARSDTTGIIAAPAFPGIERIEARFFGAMFEPHRHDTYAIGVTMRGVQTFRYRGQGRFSLPGNILVLHPDEEHDGAAGTDDGLCYRMLYLEPSLLLRALDGRTALPFVNPPVFADDLLRDALLSALTVLDEELDELFVDDMIAAVADGLTRRAQHLRKAPSPMARRQAHAARDHLVAHATRAVSSGELERISGLDRYACRAISARSSPPAHTGSRSCAAWTARGI